MMSRIASRVSHISIRAKLLIAFVGLSVLPIMLVSVYGLYVNVKSMKIIALENLTHGVSTLQARTGHLLVDVEGDVRLLLHSTPLRRYIRNQATAAPEVMSAGLAQIGDEFLAFAQTKGGYYQIRLLSTGGDEVLRVECDNMLDSIPRFSIVPPSQLPGRGTAYYFLLTDSLQDEQIAFAPAEVKYRGTQRIPVISFAAPLKEGKRRAGILVVNLFAGNLFRELEPQQRSSIDEKVVLVGSDGHYLYNSGEQHDWNRLIASREVDNLQNDYPAWIARSILADSEGVITGGSEEIIAHAPLFLQSRMSPGLHAHPGLAGSLFVFESVPRARLTQDARDSAVTFIVFLLIFLGSAVALGLLATRQFTRPISELQRGAAIIARGSYRHRLAVDTGDEIEDLARQFNSMAASLEEHEREIRQHGTLLEEMVGRRTRQLGEEKGKLQAILDNVPSALVIVDGERRIQTASAAFATVTGLRLADVIGQDSRKVFQAHHLCETPETDDVLRLGKVESHLDRTIDRDGNDRFVEHISIPMAEKGGIASILQILTDVTKRKRLEEHLIHSEKLMATGEMAAIIAHGFRNSLTSIKMILQLLQESRRLTGVNKQSLHVALDSIYRMEAVVQDLLNFARPGPMEFRAGDVNSLVKECLVLVQPRLKEHGISLKKSLDAGILPMNLDPAHLREAVTNLILNAMQAIETGKTPRRKGRVTVRTRKAHLTRLLRQFHPPDMVEEAGDSGSQRGREIVLRKGVACVVISIEDNGPGIDRTVLRRIFDPFFTTKTNGTGLGLPMVRRTVNAHGGIVTVKSMKGKGTVMDIVLPIPNGSEAKATDELAVAGVSL